MPNEIYEIIFIPSNSGKKYTHFHIRYLWMLQVSLKIFLQENCALDWAVIKGYFLDVTILNCLYWEMTALKQKRTSDLARLTET